MSKSSLYWLCLLSSSLSKRYLVTASGCFYAYNSTILPSPEFVEPCGTNMSSAGPFVNCCATRSQNICLAESICYDPYTDDGKYYLSPCTDPNYNSSVCPQYCSKFTVVDNRPSDLFIEGLILIGWMIRRSPSLPSEPARHNLRSYGSYLEVLWGDKREV